MSQRVARVSRNVGERSDRISEEYTACTGRLRLEIVTWIERTHHQRRRQPDRRRKRDHRVRVIAVTKPEPNTEQLAVGLLILAEELSPLPRAEKKAA